MVKINGNLYKSPSNRIHLLGKGEMGGKAKGLLFLDQAAEQVRGFSIPKTLVVSADFFGLPAQPANNPTSVQALPDVKIAADDENGLGMIYL